MHFNGTDMVLLVLGKLNQESQQNITQHGLRVRVSALMYHRRIQGGGGRAIP